MTPQQAAAAADLQFFTGMCIFGIVLGVLVALVVGFIGAKEHLAASERQAERQRRLDELERCRKVTVRYLSPRELAEWDRTGVLQRKEMKP